MSSTYTEPVTTDWRRSSFCADGSCVEVRRNGDRIELGKTKPSPESGVSVRMAVTFAEWDALVAGIGAGDFKDLTGRTL